MWKGSLLLLLVGTAWGQRFYGKLEKDDEYVIETPEYPGRAPANADRDYSIKTLDSNLRIHLTCSDLRLNQPPQGTQCRADMLYVFNGEKIDELCGTKSGYQTTSTSNRLNVRLRTGAAGGGYVRCVAKAVEAGQSQDGENFESYLQFSSSENDSSEWGLGGGTKTTTCPCGSSNKGRIVGGKETIPNEFPFIVGLLNIEIMFLFCGATILTPKHAITAAHCTFPRKDDKLGILVGFHDIKEKTSLENLKKKDMTGITKVVKTIEHKDYHPKQYHNDISILVLEKELEFNNLAKPVCLPTGHVDLLGQDLVVIGWGRTATKEKPSDVLRKVTLRVMPLGLCQDRFPYVNTDTPKQICTYGHGKDSCTGDSGGPVVWLDKETNRYTLVGLVSFGKKDCASENNPAVNTKVAYYLDWIHDRIRETSSGLQTCSKIG